MRERMLVRELTELCRQVHDNEQFGYLVKQWLEIYMSEGNGVTEGTALT